MKKIITSLILLFGLLSTLFAANVTLYYVNSTEWTAVNGYVWNKASDTPLAKWPGAAMTKTSQTANGFDVYSYTFDAAKYDRVIFNNNNNGAQTKDLIVDVSKPYYYEGKWYATLAEIAGADAPAQLTLYYVNDTNWSKVNAYAWIDGGAALSAWPGSPATLLDKTVSGNQVYSYTFNPNMADYIIFNNGTSQTADLAINPSKPYFYDGVWLESVTFDGNGGNTPVDPEPDPEPVGPAFYVAGNGGSDATLVWCNGIEWDPSAAANQMTDADEDGIYEITYTSVPEGSWNFKVVAHLDQTQWLGGEFLDVENSSTGVTVQNGGNIGFALTNPADVTIKVDSKDGIITITTPSGNFGTVKIDYFSVANGDECLEENRFTEENNNTLKYTVDIEVNPETELGYTTFRIIGNCNYAVFERNLLVEVTESGTYEVTIEFNGDYEYPEFIIMTVGPKTDDDDDVTTSVDEVGEINIYTKENTIYCDEPFQVYTITGVEVTHLNGALEGVYILKTENANRLISVW
jgi:hypothetical protein